jgi:hypothetical protein
MQWHAILKAELLGYSFLICIAFNKFSYTITCDLSMQIHATIFALQLILNDAPKQENDRQTKTIEQMNGNTALRF